MARNGSGAYTIPAGSLNPAVSGTTIDSSDWNDFIDDLETALSGSIAANGETPTTAVIPFASGIKSDTIAEKTSNTGVTIDGVLIKDGRIDWDKGSDVASASAPDIWATTGMQVDITGTTTITDFADAPTAGVFRILQFDGVLTLTHDAAKIVLPGGANITTAAGDIAFVYADTTTLFKVAYFRANGKPTVTESPITTRGDIITGDSSGDAQRVALGTSGYVLTSDGTDAAWAENPLPRSYLTGLQMTNGTDADHDINVAAGVCRDAADGVNISPSAIVKQIDATWASGTNAGGLSSSLTAPANSTWYHVFAILVGGSADVGFDTSVTAANLITDHSATAYRRIGSVLTDGSANIIGFIQSGDDFYWKNPPLDLNEAVSTTETHVLTVPTGVRVMARINFGSTGGATYLYIYPTDVDTETAAGNAAPLGQGGDGVNAYTGFTTVLTDTSAQYKVSQSSSQTVVIATLGWNDARGK